MSYQSFEQVLQKCHTEEKEFWQVILEDDMAERNVSLQESMEHMRATWDAMLLAAATYEGNLNSSSGLVGGDGRRMEKYTHSAGTESLCGEYVDTCIAGALQMGESNACMKRIVAAPTAGLHFTDELLEQAKKKGVELVYVTLHVGIGTFRPVKCENIEEHSMHFEEYHISEESAEVINLAKREGRRIISVGTTSTRTVESAAYYDEAAGCMQVRSGEDSTGIFIYPGYEFKIIDSLITNFHLPKSTLLMLISALYDREKILEVYEEAIREKYRFFSYGDAMFIE